MTLSNTDKGYGAVTKGFHWLTALLILAVIPLGLIANDMSHDLRDPAIAATEAMAARTALLFSIHKTIGVTIFFVALARILWALSQPRPGLINGDRPAEAFLAVCVHWLLYGSLVAVPLSGWVHHAATTGFAPIWWPFGQSLPFVPKDETIAGIAGTTHYLLQWMLIGALTLHILGAIKHHVIDRDATLRRMLPGQGDGEPTARQPGHTLPLLAALTVWAVILGGATALGWFAPQGAAPQPALAEAQGEWQVTDGTLSIEVTQMGSTVSGQFADWTADITYSETPDADGRHGAVTVTVSIPSLTLGSVTEQAMGPEYFDAGAHPTATFTADLLVDDTAQGGHVARGTLTIKDNTVPVEMPFSLVLDNDTARAEGQFGVDRRDFGIGLGTKDEGTLGFAVDIAFQLTAERR
ncbi:cytochrome b/b6 domain-containing protein [Roseovarius amoyensis]|uniref:cytochrome b/b6 domain-containing protein n=1 Tax=Roseovarius amoyensis TaxID=2211448 RepID=UPI000DBE8C27|nr:cytochrome b/b6 domain-containing protein [Roseovarius amoyensis]